MRPTDQHIFSLYIPSLEQVAQSGLIGDHALVHRMKHVLRLSVGDTVILFDDTESGIATVVEIQKKSITLTLTSKKPHKKLLPEIHWLLPLLKKDAFEESLYTLTEMGATSIQPIRTVKASRKWGSQKDVERAHGLMIAAAEQSKQYVVPTIHPVIDLVHYKPDGGQFCVFFDPEGIPLKKMVIQLEEHSSSLVGCVGPEGDLTLDEKEQLRKQGFIVCRLTPTILRAKQALAVGLGVLRSL